MTSFAGSAIAQGPTVGRIDLWSDWQPTACQPRWLLLSGASNPPDDISISNRRTRDAPGDRIGTFLPGVSHDLTNMQDTVLVKATFSNILMNLKLTKSVSLESIREFFPDYLSRKANYCHVTKNWKWRKLANWWRNYFVSINKLAFLKDDEHTLLTFYVWNECMRSLKLKFWIIQD